MTAQQTEVDRYLKAIGVLRIAFGTGAIFAPALAGRSFGMKADGSDTSVWAALVGSRAITVGLYSLTATGRDRQRDAVLLNSAVELFDAVGIARELRGGRPPASFFTVAAVTFNAVSQVVWARARRLTS